MAAPVHPWQQLKWMLWKNVRLKMRNVKSSAKELLFPVYTFLLVAFLKTVIDLGGNSEARQWQAIRVPALANTRAGWLCQKTGLNSRSDHELEIFDGEKKWRRSVSNSTSGCVVVVSPGTSLWVQSLAETLQHMFGSAASSIHVVLVDNQTEAKRFHLDNPGHVLAAIDLRGSDDSACKSMHASGGACNVKMDLRFNATGLVEVKSGMSPFSELHAGILSVLDTTHEALRRNVWEKTPADSAGKVDVSVQPMPVSSLGSLGSAEAKISFITSLYFVAAWIPSMQILLVNIVTEKKLGFRSVMRCMGLKDTVFWLAWLLSELATFSTAILLVVLIGAYTRLFAESDLSLVCAIFVLFVTSICTFSFLVSVFFTTPKVAGAVGSGLLAFFSLVFSLLRVIGASPQVFWALSLLSPIAMSSAGADMWQSGVRWSALDKGVHPLWKIMVMLAVDSLLYFVLALYFERAVGGESWDLCFCIPSFIRRRLPSASAQDAIDNVPLLDGGSLQDVSTDAVEPAEADFSAENVQESDSGAARCRQVDSSLGLAGVPPAVGRGDGRGARESAQRQRGGVVMRGVRKVFEGHAGGDESIAGPTTVAVDGVSLDLLEGQIVALLGPNGAGKSTLISMLTGMLAPTAGLISVFGRDVRDKWDLIKIHEDLGFCPQDDILLDDLTVREHLELFAGLKGCCAEEVRRRSDELDLGSVAEVQVKSLSGGMKRRLSVALALTGDPGFVVLDEPTSGMDARSRRALWATLRKQRSERVILLSTHSMEEADAIADRIAIMVHGTLKACGDSMLLKSKYGLGHRLHCERATPTPLCAPRVPPTVAPAACSTDKLEECVRRHVPAARVVATSSTEVTYQLGLADGPGAECTKHQFPPLLRALDASLAGGAPSLGISGYGITCTSLEDVFLRICEGVVDLNEPAEGQLQLPRTLPPAPEESEGAADSSEEPLAMRHFEGEGEEDLVSLPGGGATLFAGMASLRALALKLMRMRVRGRRALAHFIGYPVVVIVITFSLFASAYFSLDSLPMLSGAPLSAAALPVVSQPLSGGAGPAAYVMVLNKTVEDISPLVTALEQQELGVCIVHAEDDYDDIIGLSPQSSSHWTARPSSHSADLNRLAQLCPECQTRGLAGGLMVTGFYSSGWGGAGGGLAVTISYNSTAKLSAAALQKAVYDAGWTLRGVEKEVRVEVRVRALPGRSATAQPQGFMLAFLLTLAMLYPPAFVGEELVSEREKRQKHMLHVLGARSLDYFLSHLGCDVALFILPIATALVAGAVTHTPAFLGKFSLACGLLLLSFSVSISAFTYVVSYFFSSSKSVLKYLSTILLFATTLPLCFLFSLSVALPNTANATALVLSVFPGLAVAWGMFKVSVLAILAAELEREVPWYNIFVRTSEGQVAGGSYAVLLLATAVLFLVACVRKDLQGYWRVKTHVHVLSESDADASPEDSDVVAERQAIEQGGRAGARHLCLHHLRKVYGHGANATVAVKGLSMAAGRGECLCLLGPNGAGKTSTILMLSGELEPSGGTAVLGGKSIYSQLLQVFSILGICRQSDTLWETLTGREHLELACHLRGLAREEHGAVVSQLLSDLGIEGWADKLVKVYSGGTRRKLCTAMALVGSTSVVLLDEPSTGVDPVSKRLMWDLLRRERRRRTLLLTTHSMTEAEALSSRIGIMGKGRLRCLGSAQHVKSKYGHGVSLHVQAPPPSAPLLLQRLRSLFDIAASAAPGTAKVVVTLVGAADDGEREEQEVAVPVVELANVDEWGGEDEEARVFTFYLQCSSSREEVRDAGEGAGEMDEMDRSTGGLPLADLFAAMEDWKEELRVADYSISQVTLEQVFLTVTKDEKKEGGEERGSPP